MDSLARLNELLAARNMSLFAFTKASGIHYSTFDAAKRRCGQLSVDTIERVCDTLQIPVYEFFMTDADWENLDKYCRARSDIHEHRIINPIQT